MLNLEKRIIPKRPHANMFVKGSSVFGGMKYDTLDDVAKYAPKYCESIGLGLLKEHRNVNAFKRIKKAHEVSYVFGQESGRGQWRLIMQNKLKTICKIERENSGEESIELCKAFSNIRRRLFEDRSYWYSDFKQDRVYLKLSKKFFRFLPGMTKLKDLSLTIRPINHFSLLKKLNSMTRILNSLQGLQIKSSVVRDFQETSLLPALVENQKVLKRLTSLSLGKLTDEKSAEIFKTLPKHCKDLKHLKFDIPSKESALNLPSSSISANLSQVFEHMRLQLKHRPKELMLQISSSGPHANYLQSLENFERLEKIDLKMGHPCFFVDNFRGPLSLKHASFAFERGSWDEISQKLRFVDKDKLSKEQLVEEPTENDKGLYRFFKSWNHLDNLVSLEISCPSQPRVEAIKIFDFVTFLLSSLSSLEHGSFDLKSSYSPLETRDISIDFGNILSALQSVSSRLKSLSFIPPGQCLTTYHSDQETLSFPQLTFVDLSRNLSDSNSIQNILNMFQKSCSKESPVQLKLPSVQIWTNQTLLDSLKILSSLSRNLTTSFLLWIEDLDLETFESMFEPFIEKPFILKGVSLEIQILENFKSDRSKAFALLLKIFNDLKKEDEDDDTGYYSLQC